MKKHETLQPDALICKKQTVTKKVDLSWNLNLFPPTRRTWHKLRTRKLFISGVLHKVNGGVVLDTARSSQNTIGHKRAETHPSGAGNRPAASQSERSAAKKRSDALKSTTGVSFLGKPPPVFAKSSPALRGRQTDTIWARWHSNWELKRRKETVSGGWLSQQRRPWDSRFAPFKMLWALRWSRRARRPWNEEDVQQTAETQNNHNYTRRRNDWDLFLSTQRDTVRKICIKPVRVSTDTNKRNDIIKKTKKKTSTTTKTNSLE